MMGQQRVKSKKHRRRKGNQPMTPIQDTVLKNKRGAKKTKKCVLRIVAMKSKVPVECVLNMGSLSVSVHYAATQGAQNLLRKEECVFDMGQRSNYAALKNAQIKLDKGECASNMGQRYISYAAVKGAQQLLEQEGYVGRMG
mmetsp:Transcript_13218/g.19677  ORF Transcript_13218/g.19677 Transcript_13218/m.19677 type:complete len:141 (+) Transcript_13218:340-762(+)